MPNFDLMKLVLIFVALTPWLFFSQGADNCVNAVTLCSSQTANSGNSGASVETCSGCEDGASNSGNFCYSLNNSVWFTFLTNNTGGDVTANISNIICDNSPGLNTNLQAVIISASSPCNESTYSLVSNCVTSATNFQLNATNLLPNTTYYIQVDGDSINGDAGAAQCGFNITIQGPGVDIEIDAGEGSSIFKGETASLEGQGPNNSYWTPESLVSNPYSASTSTAPSSTTTFYYNTETSNGCVYSDPVTVVVQETLILTNTFSPNDDGINDTWYIGSIENYPAAKVTVFDRWGQKVFYSVGYGNGNTWTGKANGISVPSGVYYYHIDLNTESDEDIFGGYVTVIK